MTELTLLALRLTCPECHAEYDDAAAAVEARPAYVIFRCPHCQEGQVALAVLKNHSVLENDHEPRGRPPAHVVRQETLPGIFSRGGLPDPMPPEDHETIPGLLGWIDAVDWHGWPWQWHWKRREIADGE